ncbi:hypothetical protein LNL84_03855 [Vibrio sp. ZSDZ34]|jgi:hypothetical protein|uniref:Uncharacterized protein n=1 Tax=Vibrio gelatinilyticus TaxID=2893468 RepID=A0A9X1W7N6_9VIBR|nr:hypothetical protein [Vibrio gelatinilyticus]MCJ2375962.1 hypothetical protein [Vibrio gelatinilyticus]
MEFKDVSKGMWVESVHGIGKVLVVDEASQSVLVEQLVHEEQWALSVDEISEDPQLHNGCDQYY